MDSIKICFVSDKNYFKHMFVAINSIIKNNINNNIIEFFILNIGDSDTHIDKFINRYRNFNNIKIKIINVENEKINQFKSKTHVSKAAFAKIYMSEILNEDKIIYLDCDLIVNDDISKLWNEFDDNIKIKSVWNPFYNYDNKYFGIDESKRTFNSGVMLLNLKLIREYKLSDKLERFLVDYNNKTKLHDQAAFNAVFKDDWKELDIKWNVQANIFLNTYKSLQLSKSKYWEIYKNPSIVHYTSNSKPWHIRNNNPYKSLYVEYYEDLYGKLKFKDINIKNLMKRLKEFILYKYYFVLNSL